MQLPRLATIIMPFPQDEADRVRKGRYDAAMQYKEALENLGKAVEEMKTANRAMGRATKEEMEFLHKTLADVYAKVEGQQYVTWEEGTRPVWSAWPILLMPPLGVDRQRM